MCRLVQSLTALIAVIAATTVFGDTVIPGGTVSGTWTAAGSPYLIHGDITIQAGSLLTIGPGVDVNFQGHYILTVYGELQAVGTETDSICFFAADTLIGWKGISFYTSGNGRIEFAAVQYARSNEWGISTIFIGSEGHVDIAHCTISNNNSHNGGGIWMEPSMGANFTISHCTISGNKAGNQGGGIYGGGAGSIEYCVISENDCYGGPPTSGGGACINSPVDTVLFDHCTFSRNEGWIGEGIYLESGSYMNLQNCIFEGHPGLAIGCDGDFTVTYSDFHNNMADLSPPPTGFGDLVQVNANGDSCDIYGNIFLDPLFCDVLNGDLQIAENSPCLGAGEGGSDIGALGIGCTTVDVLEQPQPLPDEFSLSQNYPNPFNPETVIEFYLPRRSAVIVSVHNLLGEKVAELTDGVYPVGPHTIIWDGTTSGGEPASTGVYFYRIEAEGYTETRKMLLLK
jgi:predicted outer membrane repeat protein